MAEQTIKEMLKMIDAKIEHIEDITADNRAVIIKLVKQSNQIVEYLKQIEIEVVEDDIENMPFTSFMENNLEEQNKAKKLQNFIDDFMDKRDSLKEFEKELKKHKDMLTPGQIGDA